MAKSLDLLKKICSTPGGDEALDFDQDGVEVGADGTRYRLVNGVPVLRDESNALKTFPAAHVSGDIARDRIDYMCGLPGYTLLLGGGNTPFSHPRVIDVEYNLYPSTDVVADAHGLPFRSGVFQLFFAMNVFEHLREPQVAVSEVLRVLEPGGEVHIHTAFLQPLHEEPVHFFNATEYGGREWLKNFDSVECVVSPNFNPLYSVAWLSHDLLQTVETQLGRAAARKVGELRLRDLARFWSHPKGWNPAAAELFFQLPEAAQRKIAAGFEFRARKPLS